MKKPLQFITPLEKAGKDYTDTEAFKWIVSALECIYENQKLIYDLLPDNSVKSPSTVTVNVKICDECLKRDYMLNVKCNCDCHSGFSAQTTNIGQRYPEATITCSS